jgi:hypothetical protein
MLVQRGILVRSSWIFGLGALFAAVSLAAMPPQAGFVSEWYLFQVFSRASTSAVWASRMTAALAGAGLAVTVAIAFAIFIELFAIGLLGGGAPLEKLVISLAARLRLIPSGHRRLVFTHDVARIFGPYLFAPLEKLVISLAARLRLIPSGHLNFYLSLIGALLVIRVRYAMRDLVQTTYGRDFPYATLAINVLGSFLLGFLSAGSQASEIPEKSMRRTS